MQKNGRHTTLHRGLFITFSAAVALLAVSVSLWAITSGPREQAGIQGKPVLKKTVPADGSKWRRDPFKNANRGQSGILAGNSRFTNNGGVTLPPDNIRLQGIMQVDTRRYAFINGRSFRPGDRIMEGVLLKEVGRYHIIVDWHGVRHNYDVFQGKLK